MLAKRVAAERAAIDGEPPAPDAVPLPPPGHVELRILEARSGAPLESVRIRFLHEHRFAEYSGGGEARVSLTSGRWEANVAATGYEPERLDAFEIRAGETTALPPLALQQGSGIVEGHVLARHLAADQPVMVQLFGDGRAPCDRCGRPPEATPETVEGSEADAPCGCGFRPDANELTLLGDRRFRFGHLAAGSYWLRAFEPEQRITDARRIEIGRGGSAWSELEVTAPTSVKLELRHDDFRRGGLFTGDWSSVHREQPASIHFSFRRNGRIVGGVDHTPAPDDVRATMGAPILPHADGGASSEAASPWIAFRDWSSSPSIEIRFEAVLTSGWVVAADGSPALWVVGGEPERLDREREEGDELEFDVAEPEVSGAGLAVETLRPDLFGIGPLPRLPLSVVVSCGHFVSDEVPLDLRLEPFAPIVVTMHPTEHWLAQLAEIEKGPPASCAACHGDEAPPRQGEAFDFARFEGGNGRYQVIRVGEGASSGALLELRPSLDVRTGSDPPPAAPSGGE